jgi:dynein heavy chain
LLTQNRGLATHWLRCAAFVCCARLVRFACAVSERRGAGRGPNLHPSSSVRCLPLRSPMGDGPPPDLCALWIRDKICPLLKSKPELFDKLYASEEGELIRTFVGSDGCMKLFFLATTKDMSVTDKLPDDKQTKKKAVFVVKTAECVFDEKKVEEMANKIVVGDLSPAMLNNFHALMRNVYLPIMSNPKNTAGWPDIAMKAFADKFHSTLASVYVAIGQTQGKTLLALPPGEMLGSASGSATGKDRADKDRVHVLESVRSISPLACREE